MKKFIGAILVLALVLGAVFISKNNQDATMDMPKQGSTKHDDTAQATATDMVTISNFKFMPATITVKKGTTVTWKNTDSIAHTVTADTMPGPDSGLLGNDEVYSYTFDKAGTYTYNCKPHEYMKGTVVVTD